MKYLFVLLAALALATCGETKPRCLPSNCNGCCSQNECVVGTGSSACGSRGVVCTPCTSAQACFNGTCRAGAFGGGTATGGGETGGGTATGGGETGGGTATGGGGTAAGGGGTATGGGGTATGGGGRATGGGGTATGGGGTATGGGGTATGGGGTATGGGGTATGGGGTATGGGGTATGGGGTATGGGGTAAGGGGTATGGGGTATGGGGTATGGGTAANHLVINEVDYDNPPLPDGGVDSLEFVEIVNPTAGAISLVGLAVVFVNGANGAEYVRVSLDVASSLGAGGYLVVGPPAVTQPLSAAVKKVGFPGTVVTNLIQNGPADGVAIVTSAGLLIDSVSYQGAATWTADGGISLQEGAASTSSLADSNVANVTICRIPNSSDTNVNATDFKVCSTPTPGAVNIP